MTPDIKLTLTRYRTKRGKIVWVAELPRTTIRVAGPSIVTCITMLSGTQTSLQQEIIPTIVFGTN